MDVLSSIIVALAGFLVWRAETRLARMQTLIDHLRAQQMPEKPSTKGPVLVWTRQP
jgi:hypothetical protein